MKLRTKLMITYILLIPLPIMIFGLMFYQRSRDILMDNARKDNYAIVKKNNTIMDIKLAKIKDKSLAFMTDQQVYKIFKKNLPEEEYELMQMDKVVSDLLDRHFGEYDYVYASYVVTRNMSFGKRTEMFIPHKSFYRAPLYKEALKGGGSLIWEPTFDFVEMFDLAGIAKVKIDYQYIFSAIRLVEPVYIGEDYSSAYNQGGGAVVKKIDAELERPVLMIVMKEAFLSDIYESSISVEGSQYVILNNQGQVISAKNKELLHQQLKNKEVLKPLLGHSGSRYLTIDGKEYLVCFDTSKITGWTSVVLIPYEEMLGELKEIRRFAFYVGVLLMVVAIMIAFLIGGWIVGPIKKLVKAMNSVSKGDFSIRIQDEGSGEVASLIHNFNHMNGQIEQLIEENYRVKIREKEAHIMALNLQLNPHFLSNTLNVINWMAIDEEQEEISSMIISLSTMLDYTLRNSKELVLFREDFKWLSSYLHIMMNRYQDIFIVEYDVDEGLDHLYVPKLFLQPIVENAIIHGFEEQECGGILTIKGKRDEINSQGVFTIEDNGKGISEEILSSLSVELTVEEPRQHGFSIGINNIRKRIQLLFGADYGLDIESKEQKGTRVTIRIPL